MKASPVRLRRLVGMVASAAPAHFVECLQQKHTP